MGESLTEQCRVEVEGPWVVNFFSRRRSNDGRGICPLTGDFAAKWHRRINSYDSGPSEPCDSPPNGTTKLWLWPTPANTHPRSTRYPWTKQPMAADKDPSVSYLLTYTLFMDLQNTAFTVQLGRGAMIQLANAIVETRNARATIQFGSVDFLAIAARTAAIPVNGRNTKRFARRLNATEALTHRVHLPAPRPTTEQPRRRVSVFERLSKSEASTAKRVVTGGRISLVASSTTTPSTGLSAPGRYDVEASSGGRLTRRQRRKKNTKLRAQQQFLIHPSNLSVQEIEANIPTWNKFSDLKWRAEAIFLGPTAEVPAPPKKREPETLLARVYRVLKTVKENGLQKRRYQRLVMIEARRTPPRKRLSFPASERNKRGQRASHGEHRGVTPEHRIWRPKPHRDEEENEERVMNLGVTSDVASQRSAPNSQEHQKWSHDDTYSDGQHLRESSRGSHLPATLPKEESNFDHSPRVEEVFLPSQEPEIQWRRHSEIHILEEEEKDDMEGEIDIMGEEEEEEEEEMNDSLNMEVVYMMRHTEVDYDDGEDDGDWHPQPRRRRQRQREIDSIIGEGEHSQREQEVEEVEENPLGNEDSTLADIRRQMRAKDREISQLNKNMTEMMA
ncbi:hypothetical protein M5K25_013366 [Dendrobium thyrsiflorum]|uniref:Uncharacterized protein n=1 Tax=Dendrobium thyrsiflorum TaxID=117978 RepID=A0ABD0UT95_DENTH